MWRDHPFSKETRQQKKQLRREGWIFGCSRKNPNGGGRVVDICFRKKPWKFQVCYFTLRNLGQSKESPWKLHKIVLHTLLGDSNTKYQHPWKFHMNISSVPMEIPCTQPLCLDFFKNSLFEGMDWTQFEKVGVGNIGGGGSPHRIGGQERSVNYVGKTIKRCWLIMISFNFYQI